MSRSFLLVLLLAGAGLAACSLRPTPAAAEAALAHTGLTPTLTAPPPTAAPSLTPTPEPSPASTATRAPLPETLFTATPAPVPCVEAQGTVTQVSVPSDTLNYPIDARVYLPPCYDRTIDRYPVLYLIHGLNFTEDQWERLGVARAADLLIAAQAIAPLIIVLPRDRRDARLDPALVDNLIPYIDARYRTLADREHRAIGGLSRGGGWSIHFGLGYPDVFGRMGAHSPAIFFEDERAILRWARTLPPDQTPAIYIDIGESDGQRQSAVWLNQVLTWFDVEHTYIVRPGGHSEKYWAAHLGEYLRFYAADWRAAPSPTPTFVPEDQAELAP